MNDHEMRLRMFIKGEGLEERSMREVLTRVVKQEHGDIKAIAAAAELQNAPERFSDLIFEDHVTSLYELSWPPGDPGTEIHDHGESTGAVYIVRGTVKETFWANNFKVVRYWREGQVILIPKNYIHKFEDGSNGTEACSLHLYEPPLKHMNFYQDMGNGLLVPSGQWDE
jgi:hypothetical protein